MFDIEFMIINDEISGLISYIGKKYTKIQYDMRLYQWNMTVANQPRVYGVCYSDVSSMVIGKHSWIIGGDYSCSRDERVIQLALSSCSVEEFTCSDGVCIDILLRCDNIPHCRDKSDEADCERVKMQSSYQKYIVPSPNNDEDDKLEVDIVIKVETIMDIDEVEGHFQVQFYLTMKWFESRLIFNNLKDDISLNNFLPSENQAIWVPQLIFENTNVKPRTRADDLTSIKVKKLGQFVPSDISETQNTQYFSGSENQIQMSRFYNEIFLCDYKMAWYPFDVQQCHMIMASKEAFEPFIELRAEKIAYVGETLLTKYEVHNVTMDIIDLNYTHAVSVEITLGRELLSVIMNIFVPTLVLNIISYSTNFYKDCYFESVITINLTSMLVLVALFVSVSISLSEAKYNCQLKCPDILLSNSSLRLRTRS